MDVIRKLAASLLALSPLTASAAEAITQAQDTTARTGVSAIWILANVSYAGMRAQNSPSATWRIISFIFGFPGTLLSLLVVREGSERAYGIELPRGSARPDDGA